MRKKILHISLTVLITVVCLLLGIFAFGTSYLRLYEAVKDLRLSLRYFFCNVFNIENTAIPKVMGYSEILSRDTFLPADFDGFKEKTQRYFGLLFSGENISAYVKSVIGITGGILKALTIVVPVAVGLWFLVGKLYEKGNVKHNTDTLPLKAFKSVVAVTYEPVKKLLKEYIRFLKARPYIYKIWIAVWLFNLNICSVIAGFWAYFFYFSASFDLSTVYVQVVKLFIDLQVIFRCIPAWGYFIIGYIVFDTLRKKTAIRRLNRFEARNCGFINELPIVSMSCGAMGKKKTTLITDMALSQEVMFRQRAFEILQQCDMRYPRFPWICFESELRKCMEYGTVYNLATVRKWIELKERRFGKHKNAELQLYGYDYVKYGSEFNDALRVSGLFDTLLSYAQSYFIYVTESSLIVSNYSVRTGGKLIDGGNFPMQVNNFFPETVERKGRFSHILDFDVLRLGKKVIENNPNAGSFEFGVVLITEVGKERGNNLELKEVKKDADSANQKNDLFNSWLKMCRHSATVENFPFIKVFTDEQRPESWGADCRDLCDIVRIVSSGEQRLALPFYTLENMISERAFDKFVALYYDFRFRRGDNTLLVHILKSVTAMLWRRNLRVYNRYGYTVLRLFKERGTQDGKPEKKKYFLMNRKIYSRRFSTDCFSDYFNDLAGKSKAGLSAYLEYAAEKASVEELKKQNSYFINSLYK